MIKTALRFIVVLLVMSAIVNGPIATSQPCGSVQNCNPNLSYPYRFCNIQTGGQPIVRCSNNPNAEPGLMPYRAPGLPACAKRVVTDDDPTSATMLDVNNQEFQVNHPTDWEDVINDAVDVWNCLCGFNAPNSSLNTCCIPVVWSNNPADFDDAANDLGIFRGRIDLNNCRPPCENGVLQMNQGRPRIYLNRTSNFTRINEAASGNLLRRSLYSGTVLPSGPGGAALQQGFAVFSMRDVVTHEFGHWLGMLHTDQIPDCFPGVTKTGIMRAFTDANRNPRTLSEQDKCQFMKLYCANLTPVEWDDVREVALGTPGLLLQLTNQWAVIVGVDCDITRVEAFDVEGRTLGSLPINFEPGAKRLNINFGDVANGPLLAVFYCFGRRDAVRRTFLIQHLD